MSASDRKPCSRERRDAKALLIAVRAGDTTSITHVKKYIHDFDPSRFSLMTAQHVIAKENGFDSWGDMLKKRGAS